MAGLDPAISAALVCNCVVIDGRVEPGHDGYC
jgi:hypothetical protein